MAALLSRKFPAEDMWSLVQWDWDEEKYSHIDLEYEQCHSDQIVAIIFEAKDDGLTYRLEVVRSGSPFIGWYDLENETSPVKCARVEKRPVTREEWVDLNDYCG